MKEPAEQIQRKVCFRQERILAFLRDKKGQCDWSVVSQQRVEQDRPAMTRYRTLDKPGG